jgi:hypothetical protein
LSRWQRLGLAVLFAVFIGFGLLVEWRSAFLKRRMTDFGVYVRAAWAVRTGHDFYTITDDNGWHYHYPPLFAILLTPFADPPPGADRSGMLPFAVSVAMWYVLSVLCLVVAVHWLANALENEAAAPFTGTHPRGGRRSGALRVLPVLVCLPTIGHTLMRGQVNLFLLLLLCGMAAAVLRRRPVQAGLWLAGAICLKVIPAFLLIYPLWRRDLRFLAGCGAGLLIGLGGIPVLVFGPTQTLTYYREWDEVLRRPALTNGPDQSRAEELIKITRTDSQSFQAVIHNTLNLERATRPAYPTDAVRWAHWLIGGLLTAVTVLAAGWRRAQSGVTEVIFLGVLILLMLLLSPVCHLHYFCLSLPLLIGLLAFSWERQPTSYLKCGWWLLLFVYFIANALPQFPGLELLRDIGLAMYAALLLWLVANAVLWKQTATLTGPEASRQFATITCPSTGHGSAASVVHQTHKSRYLASGRAPKPPSPPGR